MQSNLEAESIFRRWRKPILGGVVAGLLAALWLRQEVPHPQNGQSTDPVAEEDWAFGKGDIAEALTGLEQFPLEVNVKSGGSPRKVLFQYSLDSKLQDSMERLFHSYTPDFGAFVAIDPDTGRVLSMVSFSRNGRLRENLALRATFPSASIFKVVTAAAVIAEKKFTAETVIPFNGRNHTLYKNQVTRNEHTRWTRYMTLKEAFARSVNTVFGKIGAYALGQERLSTYADRFGFNRKIASDLPFQQARAPISADPWDLAESASGFTKDTTMSPLHGALIAAAVVNDGRMMEPWIVQSAHDEDGSVLYRATPRLAMQSIDEPTARELRELMRETVSQGTSRKIFRGFFKGGFNALEVGGKTGSLTGDSPRGKYDWFVGYGEAGTRRIAMAALTVNERQWKVKSSYLARRALEAYFKEQLGVKKVAQGH